MASNVVNRMALAFPVFRMDKLASVIPNISARAFERIFRLAIITSKLTMIAMLILLIRSLPLIDYPL